ncbi:hypothetical protein DFH08DRAFT_960608 [Mycena albidolilacea]|uniref:Uncharacterized protein n=1 Tax=Mycena albidolilacea TaxID=1033008 RepID=A0AAD7ES05_9AGAR|nr:hypothetical protein DFH08DRAFT_960608 [Mycena albidolilacea]
MPKSRMWLGWLLRKLSIEEFLALLTAVKHLALIITMRGAERPAKEFLPPSIALVQCLRKLFYALLDLYKSIMESSCSLWLIK